MTSIVRAVSAESGSRMVAPDATQMTSDSLISHQAHVAGIRYNEHFRDAATRLLPHPKLPMPPRDGYSDRSAEGCTHPSPGGDAGHTGGERDDYSDGAPANSAGIAEP